MSTPSISLPVLHPSGPAAPPAPVLPPLYARWMESLLGGTVPNEPFSTCANCAMSRPSAEAATGHAQRFRADAKCCTYQPTLWNFLVGGVLAEVSPETARGRETVERRIDRALAVSPLGLRMSSTYELLYRSKLDTFGRNPAFRCPHYINEGEGLCGVGRHRNSVCATYFCKLSRGAVGQEFWARLRQLLGSVEESLARWCMVELEVESEVLGVLFPTPSPAGAPPASSRDDWDGGPEPAQRLRLWGRRWIDREREFYREAHHLVASLSWDDVLRVCGPAAATLAPVVLTAYAALLDDGLPARLRLGRFTVVPQEEPGVAYLSAYTPADMPRLPSEMLGYLPLFDGRSETEEVLARIEERTSVRLSPADVRRLVDHGVLAAVTPE